MTAPGPDDKVYSCIKIATILESLAGEGVAANDVLSGTSLSLDSISAPDTRVSINQIIECYRKAMGVSRDRDLAFHNGLRLHVSAYGVYGFAMLCSTNFRETIRFSLQYRELATPLVEISFEQRGALGIWSVTPMDHPRVDSRLGRFLVEQQFGTFMALHQDVMGTGFAPTQLRLIYDASSDPQQRSSAFGCPVLFEQSENQFVFDAAWLDKTPKFGNAITYAEMVKLCDQLLEEFRLQVGVAGTVRKLLLVNRLQSVSFSAIANRLKMSPRTLRRRLHDENVSFRRLIGELRMNMAVKFLRDTSLTIEEISRMVGFSEPAGFRRSFRRETQVTPEQFRRGVVQQTN